MSKKKKTPTKLIAIYERSPISAMTGWHIKENHTPFCPLGILPEPYGGRKVNGRSPYQIEYAMQMALAPELVALAKKVRKLERENKNRVLCLDVNALFEIYADARFILAELRANIRTAKKGKGK